MGSRRARHAGLIGIGVGVCVVTLTAFVFPRATSPAVAPVPPPGQLVVDSSLLVRLGVLAAGLRREIVLCLTGTSDGPTAVATSFLMPEPKVSTGEHATFGSCPQATVAMWHNHPLEGLPGDPNANPRDFCALSETDIRMAARAAVPFVVIAVDANTWCWWTKPQVHNLDAQHALRGDPVFGQIESLTPAGARPYTVVTH